MIQKAPKRRWSCAPINALMTLKKARPNPRPVTLMPRLRPLTLRNPKPRRANPRRMSPALTPKPPTLKPRRAARKPHVKTEPPLRDQSQLKRSLTANHLKRSRVKDKAAAEVATAARAFTGAWGQSIFPEISKKVFRLSGAI